MKLTKLALVMATAVAASGFAAQAGDLPEKTFKYGSVLPQGNAISDVDEYFAQQLSELSDGKLSAEIFWTRALGKADEMLEMIEAGIVDFTMLETGQYSQTAFSGVMNALPMVQFDADAVVSTAKSLYSDSETVSKELDAIGARVALVRPSPGYYLICKSPIETVADFKGKKLRAYGAYVPLMWEAVGGVPVNVASNELYEALDKGVIDCAYLPPSFHAAFKLHEVAKYLIDFSFGMIELAPIVVPTLTWDSWSPEVQDVVKRAAANAEEWGITHIVDNSDASVATMVSEGATLVTFKEPDALKAAIPDMLDVWVGKQAEAGRGDDAKAVADLIRNSVGG